MRNKLFRTVVFSGIVLSGLLGDSLCAMDQQQISTQPQQQSILPRTPEDMQRVEQGINALAQLGSRLAPGVAQSFIIGASTANAAKIEQNVNIFSAKIGQAGAQFVENFTDDLANDPLGTICNTFNNFSGNVGNLIQGSRSAFSNITAAPQQPSRYSIVEVFDEDDMSNTLRLPASQAAMLERYGKPAPNQGNNQALVLHKGQAHLPNFLENVRAGNVKLFKINTVGNDDFQYRLAPSAQRPGDILEELGLPGTSSISLVPANQAVAIVKQFSGAKKTNATQQNRRPKPAPLAIENGSAAPIIEVEEEEEFHEPEEDIRIEFHPDKQPEPITQPPAGGTNNPNNPNTPQDGDNSNPALRNPNPNPRNNDPITPPTNFQRCTQFASKYWVPIAAGTVLVPTTFVFSYKMWARYATPTLVTETSRAFWASNGNGHFEMILNDALVDKINHLTTKIKATLKDGDPVAPLLISGPDGCGKKMCVHFLAHATHMDYAHIDAEKLCKMSTDEVHKQLSKLTRWANAGTKPMLLFFDKADTLLSGKSMNSKIAAIAEEVAEFMDEELPAGMLVFAVNDKCVLDRTFKSRFSKNSIPLLLPTAPELARMLDQAIDKIIVHPGGRKRPSAVDVSAITPAVLLQVAQQLEAIGFTGRDVTNLVNALAKAASSEGSMSPQLLAQMIADYSAQHKPAAA